MTNLFDIITRILSPVFKNFPYAITHAMVKHVIVGTAGHIDHGKTALIKALTGTDADRLKEEQQRGITIDIGFAFLSLPNGIELGIIDVPGHEKFVKNMLAGVGGIDVAILVIAADEGIMPQTEEHLAICDLLRIQRGLVALTKTDLVEADWLEMVTEDVRDGLKGTFLQDAPIVPVSSKTGEGLDALRQALGALAEQVTERSADGILRLPIDRVFTIKGFGTVATGTLISGSIANEQMIEILPERIVTRVRTLQVHDQPVERAHAGQRTAVNLHGLEKRAIERGSVICAPNLLTPTHMIDAALTLSPKADRPLEYRSRVRFHHGTSEILARVVFFDREELLPGESAYVQFRMETPLIALARDRYIIRHYSPVTTIGGGEILHAHPQKHKRSAATVERMAILERGTLDAVLSLYAEDAGVVPLAAKDVTGMLAVAPASIQDGLRRLIAQGALIRTGQEDEVIHAEHYRRMGERIEELLTEFHAQFPLKTGIAKEELRKKLPAELPPKLFQRLLDDLQGQGVIAVEQNLVRKQAHRIRLSQKQEQIKQALEDIYRRARFQPPSRKEALQQAGVPEKESEPLLNVLLVEKTLIKVEEDMLYHREALAQIIAAMKDYLTQHQEISIGDVKQLFDISRKYSVPIMAYLDAENITVRMGDVRMLRTA